MTGVQTCALPIFATHREALVGAAIAPFELVVVNLYPFAAAAERPGITFDELVEEIDIGGPSMVRAAAKNHASVAILTDPADYPAVLAELAETGEVVEPTRRRLAVAAYALTAGYDAMIVRTLGPRLAAEPDAGARLPERLALSVHRAALLRYGENPHQAAAVYLDPSADPDAGPFARGVEPLQGKALSYNNLLDAAAAAGIARDLRGHGIAIVKHGNPCGATEGDDPTATWELALAGDQIGRAHV